MKAIELPNLLEERDWATSIKVNNESATALFAQGRDGEAREILERISTIEETMGNE